MGEIMSFSQEEVETLLMRFDIDYNFLNIKKSDTCFFDTYQDKQIFTNNKIDLICKNIGYTDGILIKNNNNYFLECENDTQIYQYNFSKKEYCIKK
jgi:hypothetical protein